MKIFIDGKYYDFYIPEFKYQFVAWLEEHYKRGIKNLHVINWNKFTAPQLKNIYIKRRIYLEDEYENKKTRTQEAKTENGFQVEETGQLSFI